MGACEITHLNKKFGGAGKKLANDADGKQTCVFNKNCSTKRQTHCRDHDENTKATKCTSNKDCVKATKNKGTCTVVKKYGKCRNRSRGFCVFTKKNGRHHSDVVNFGASKSPIIFSPGQLACRMNTTLMQCNF